MRLNGKIKIIIGLIWHGVFFVLGLAMPVLQKRHTGYYSDGLFLMLICWGISCLPWALMKTQSVLATNVKNAALGTFTMGLLMGGFWACVLVLVVGAFLSPFLLIYYIWKFCQRRNTA